MGLALTISETADSELKIARKASRTGVLGWYCDGLLDRLECWIWWKYFERFEHCYFAKSFKNPKDFAAL